MARARNLYGSHLRSASWALDNDVPPFVSISGSVSNIKGIPILESRVTTRYQK